MDKMNNIINWIDYLNDLSKQKEEYLWEEIKNIILNTGKFDISDYVLQITTPQVSYGQTEGTVVISEKYKLKKLSIEEKEIMKELINKNENAEIKN